jgi:phosphoserine phosphatase RsbU/P
VTNSAKQKKRLKLYTEQPPKPVRSPIETVASLPRLMQAFQAASGWALRCAGTKSQRANPKLEISDPPSDQRPSSSKVSPPPVPRSSAATLATRIGDLLGELLDTRRALREREAELAAGVPMVPHREEEKHLAERLEAALRAGALGIGCDAAALYLLDEGTTELKLRSSWGLPFDRLTAPARPLQGALADLEALLGHAVVVNDDALMAAWNVPEDFPAAVCVPLSSPTTLLGTLWVFSNEHRDFNDRETNIVEVVAGRVAADLEREMLLRAGVDGANLQKQVAAAERLQTGGLPTIAPLLDGWDVAGRTAQAQSIGGAMHDWFCLPDGLLAVAVGRAAEQGVAGALTAAALKTALRSHARHHCQADHVLAQAHRTLWMGSAGDQHATAFLGLVDTPTGHVSGASAGRPSMLLLQSDRWRSLDRCSMLLGAGPEAEFEQFSIQLQPGDALVVFTDSFSDAADPCDRAAGQTEVAQALQGRLDLSAAELVAAAEAVLETNRTPERVDRSILVVKRAPA